MPTKKSENGRTLALAAAVIAMVVAACGRSPQPEAVPSPPEPAPSSAVPAESSPAAPADSAAAPASAPGDSAVAPATVPSKPMASNEPAIGAMRAATPSAKMSVAADLKYQFDGEVIAGQPLTLHLAVIPRVAGQNLTVSVKQVEGVSIAATPVSIAKASAGGIYRQTLAITKSAAAPASLRVLVTMDMGEGKAFGFFSVPLDNGRNPQNKQDSVKQR